MVNLKFMYKVKISLFLLRPDNHAEKNLNILRNVSINRPLCQGQTHNSLQQIY